MPHHKAELLFNANNNGDLENIQKNQSPLIFMLTQGNECALLFVILHFQPNWHL